MSRTHIAVSSDASSPSLSGIFRPQVGFARAGDAEVERSVRRLVLSAKSVANADDTRFRRQMSPALYDALQLATRDATEAELRTVVVALAAALTAVVEDLALSHDDAADLAEGRPRLRDEVAAGETVKRRVRRKSVAVEALSMSTAGRAATDVEPSPKRLGIATTGSPKRVRRATLAISSVINLGGEGWDILPASLPVPTTDGATTPGSNKEPDDCSTSVSFPSIESSAGLMIRAIPVSVAYGTETFFDAEAPSPRRIVLSKRAALVVSRSDVIRPHDSSVNNKATWEFAFVQCLVAATRSTKLPISNQTLPQEICILPRCHREVQLTGGAAVASWPALSPDAESEPHAPSQVVFLIVPAAAFGTQYGPLTACSKLAAALERIPDLRHPNVVIVYGVFRFRDAVACAMPRPGGGCSGVVDDNGLLTTPRFSSASTARVAKDLAAALACVHGAGEYHGCVRPEFVWLETPLADDGTGEFHSRAQLVVFGEAFASVSPSPLYLHFTAPEVLEGAPRSIASDAWAFGATLYCLLFGRVPFAGQTTEATREAILTERLRFPPESLGHHLRRWRGVLEALLERDPEMRLSPADLLGPALDAISA